MLVTVIADASFDPPTRAGGFGYWAVSERTRKSGGGPFKSLCRNSGIAEMMAIVNAVHLAFVHGVALEGDAILAQSDCTAAITAFEGKRYSLQPDETMLVEGLTRLLALKKATIRFRHVKGHTNGDTPRLWVNNLCDKLAKEGMRGIRRNVEHLPLFGAGAEQDKTKPRRTPEQIEARRRRSRAKNMRKRLLHGNSDSNAGSERRMQDQQVRRQFAFESTEDTVRSIPPWE
jgi:ribonuclease HI